MENSKLHSAGHKFLFWKYSGDKANFWHCMSLQKHSRKLTNRHPICLCHFCAITEKEVTVAFWPFSSAGTENAIASCEILKDEGRRLFFFPGTTSHLVFPARAIRPESFFPSWQFGFYCLRNLVWEEGERACFISRGIDSLFCCNLEKKAGIRKKARRPWKK